MAKHHKNVWPHNVKDTKSPFTWPKGKIEIKNPCGGKHEVELDPAVRPLPVGTWKEQSHQMMWDFCYFVSEVSRLIKELNEATGTAGEPAARTALENYLDDPQTAGPVVMGIDDISVQAVLADDRGKQIVKSVRIEGSFLLWAAAPSGYSSSSSSVTIP